MPDELSRLEWYKRSSANLRAYLAELEAVLASHSLGDMRATEQIVAEVNRRLTLLDELIAEAEAERARAEAQADSTARAGVPRSLPPRLMAVFGEAGPGHLLRWSLRAGNPPRPLRADPGSWDSR